MRRFFSAAVLAGVLITSSSNGQSVLPNNSPAIQGSYNFNFTGTGQNGNEACGTWAGNYVHIDLNYSDGTVERIKDEQVQGYTYNMYIDTTKVVSVINPITSIFIRTHRQYSNLFGCNNSRDDQGSYYFNYQTTSGCAYTYSNTLVANAGNVLGPSTSEIKVTPRLKYLQTQNGQFTILPTQDKITLKAPFGFPSTVYTWQYAVSGLPGNPVFVNFPAAFNGNSTISFNATDLLGTNTSSYINQPIRFRLRACGPPTANNETLSDTIQLSIRKDAPRITSLVSFPAACFDASNGGATVQFSRALVANEELYLIFNQLDTVSNSSTTIITDTLTAGLNNYTTPSVLAPGKYVLDLIGTFYTNGQSAGTFTGNTQFHTDTFYVQKPTPVVFSDTSVNVWCYSGSDGQIKLNASGGVGNYSYRFYTTANPDTAWYPFSNAIQHTISGLLPGIYSIKVRDGNGCVSKTLGGLGPDKVDVITITQPADSIHVDFVSQQIPTAYGFTDGNIHVAVYGGTINGNNTYNHTWTDANNNSIITDSTWFANGQYHILLLHIGAGTYTLALHDKNYNLATTSAGCEMTRSYVMTQPLPLMVQLQIARLPSCNKTNTQADPYADGELVAHASGGTPFATGLPYLYTWKKKDAQNNWVVMTGYTDSIASALESGWYAVNVQDAHGIILGQYVSNVLVQATDSTIFLPEPSLLTIHETVTPVTCNGNSNGVIVSGVSGGTQPYRYFWNTGDSTANLSSLEAGGYFLFVRDTNGCRATKAIVVPEPVGYVLTVDTTAPTCHDGCDGGIGLHLIGGTQPYTYTWQQTTANIDTLSGLCSGTYHVTIADANGCSFGRVIMLDNPPLLDPGIPKDTTLCNGQSARISMGIHDAGASYNWTSDNGFASADSAVILTAAGHYYAQLTNGKGCVGRDTFTIHRLNLDIAADMLLPTSAIAGEEIVLVNVSRPLPQIVEWILPQAATVLERTDNFIRFLFADTGTYPITLRTGINDCREQITRNVVVSPDDNLPGVGATAAPFIEDLKVMPVPNDGHFTVLLNLHEISAATIRLIYLNSSAVLEQRSLSEHKQYVETFALPGLAPGLYMLLVETPQEKRTIKVIVQ